MSDKLLEATIPLELEQLTQEVSEEEAEHLNVMLDQAPTEQFRLGLTQEIIETLRYRRYGLTGGSQKLRDTIAETERREMRDHINHGLSHRRLKQLEESDEKCEECTAYHGGHSICDDCGEFLHIDTWPACTVKSPVTGHVMKGHERVLHMNAKGAPDTLFYYNPQTKDVYMPGHTERHTSPESRGYIKCEIGVRQYGLKSKFYRFLDRLAIDRRWKRLEKEDAMFSPLMKENRARLARRLQTDFGREMAYEAIKKSNSSSEIYEPYAPGSHIEAWEWDEKNIRDGRSNDPLPSLEKKQLAPEVAIANAKKYKAELPERS